MNKHNLTECSFQKIDESQKINLQKDFHPPFPGDKVYMFCLNCGYRGIGTLPEKTIFNKNQKMKCPKCNKKTFIQDFRIKY